MGHAERGGAVQCLAQGVASLGLMLVVLRPPASRAAGAVAAYIGATCWFTASASFANPAATVGRMISDCFAGIAPASVPAFVAAQLVGALPALPLHRALGAISASPP